MDNFQKPVQIKIVDWQLVRFGSPVLDLSYFLYTSGSKEIFSNLNMYLKIYYNSLSKVLENCCYCSNDLFPFEVLQEQWKTYSKFGLGMAFLVVNVMLMDNNELPDVTTKEQTGEDFIKSFQANSGKDAQYIARMKDIILHFYENEWL